MSLNQLYFNKFPLISYANNNVRNILARTKLLEAIRKDEIALLPYTVEEGERADTIANFYYNSPEYVWAIYLVNNIVDPATEWPKSQYDLESFIEKKYGSLEKARDVILFYRVNWAKDSSVITPDQYNALPTENKKYWVPNYGYNRGVLNYTRKQLEWSIDTNRIDLLTVTSNTEANTFNYQVGERVYQYSNTEFLSVKGTIVAVSNVVVNTASNTTASIYVKQVEFGNTNLSNFITSSNNELVGRLSNSSSVVLTSERIDNKSIILTKLDSANSFLSTSELIYWEPVNAEDYERELNEQRKEIKILDRGLIRILEENLQNLLRPNV